MSLYRFLVAKQALPEVDHTGFVRMTVEEYRKLCIPSQGLVNLADLDPKAEVLYAADEHKIHDLKISLCSRPPMELEWYMDMEGMHIYWLSGIAERTSWQEQMLQFLRVLPAGLIVEVWSLWVGDGYKQEVRESVIKRQQLTAQTLLVLKEHNIRIQLV